MAYKRLSEKALMVDRGYGQVEPNHLSAQRTAEIYAQLPAANTIKVLENGMFVKYDYAKGVCDFTGPGEWMLVYNEIKVYRDNEQDHDFAMINYNYNARIYSPVEDKGPDDAKNEIGKASGITDRADMNLPPVYEEGAPYTVYNWGEAKMPEGTKMVPRVLKTHEGDIFTTNTVKTAWAEITVGDLLKIDAEDGYLVKDEASTAEAITESTEPMLWQVVKKYSMPDMQHGVKIMRVK